MNLEISKILSSQIKSFFAIYDDYNSLPNSAKIFNMSSDILKIKKTISSLCKFYTGALTDKDHIFFLNFQLACKSSIFNSFTGIFSDRG